MMSRAKDVVAVAAVIGAIFPTNCNNSCAYALQASSSFHQHRRGHNVANHYLDDPEHPLTYGYWEGHPFTYDPTNHVEPNDTDQPVQSASDTHQDYRYHYSSPPLEEVDEPPGARRISTSRRRSKLSPQSALSSSMLSKRRKSQMTQPTRTPLLSFDEEKDITAAIQCFRSVTRARDNLLEWMSRESQHGELCEYQWASSCSLTVDQLRDVVARGQEAKTKLIEGNIGLVTMIAKRYYNMLNSSGMGRASGGGAGGTDATLQLDDLIQTGYMGIMEAAERFDPTKGCRFSTYATHWIRQRIVRAIGESSRMIRLPVHVQTIIRNMHKLQKELEAQIGRPPSMPELAHEMGVPLDKINLYKHLSKNVLSLELPVDKHENTEDKRTLGDRVACTEMATPDEDFLSESMRGEIHAMLDVLGHDERLVLTHRYGLDDGRPKSVRETAEIGGVSSDTIRAVEAKALNKLRQPRINYRLKDYVGGEAHVTESSYGHYGGESMTSGDEEQHQQQHYYNYPVHMPSDNFVRDGDLGDYDERPTPESIWSF